jgi:hypothetical protein
MADENMLPDYFAGAFCRQPELFVAPESLALDKLPARIAVLFWFGHRVHPPQPCVFTARPGDKGVWLRTVTRRCSYRRAAYGATALPSEFHHAFLPIDTLWRCRLAEAAALTARCNGFHERSSPCALPRSTSLPVIGSRSICSARFSPSVF